MADNETIVPSLKIVHKGLFDMGDIYANIKHWLYLNGYGEENRNFQEIKYVERIKGDAKQIESKWLARKEVTGYFANLFEITFFVIGMVDAETEREGKKVKAHSGQVTIGIKAILIKDKKSTWNPLLKSFYERFIIPDRLETYRGAIYGKAFALHDEIKAYLGIQY
jgi:hypothetical protein